MKKRVKNNILKGSIITAILCIFISACCFDGESVLIPVIFNYISIAWLYLMYKANK